MMILAEDEMFLSICRASWATNISVCPLCLDRFITLDSILDRSDDAFETFATYVKNGYHGLCISRYFPKKIRTKYSLEKTPMLWLSHTDSDESHLDPSNLGVLTNILRDFFEKTEKGIVLLEGLEYLIIQNGFDTVLRFIQYLNEHVVTNNVILILPFNEESLEKKEMALLKAELEVVD